MPTPINVIIAVLQDLTIKVGANFVSNVKALFQNTLENALNVSLEWFKGTMVANPTKFQAKSFYGSPIYKCKSSCKVVIIICMQT